MAIFSFDIFCRVVDNFGDIGICWRLAQQLANEHKQDVRLWVDDLGAFNKICPQIAPNKNTQTTQQVTICKWTANPPLLKPKQVIIEAFACDLPPAFLTQLTPQNLWLNFEYLTCENWAQNWHGLPSLQNNNLRKYVYFPSLLPNTGGILFENDLKKRLQNFNKNEFLASLNIQTQKNEQLISLFCYESANLNSWFELLSKQPKATKILVPDGQIIPKINAFLGRNLTLNNPIKYNNLTLQLINFMAQNEFDYLLSACDFNIVRGEDSFLRAQFSGKPFLWHIYPQNEDAHLAKLTAFLALYLEDYSDKEQIKKLFLRFNQSQNWANFWTQIDFKTWLQHAQNWANYQLNKPNLAHLLLRFVAERL